MKPDRKICVGMVAGPHGVRGLVRLRSFTEYPEDIATYEPLTDETGKTRFAVTIKSAAKDFFIASIKGVESREAAEAMRGTKFYVERAALPPPGKREYYESDLVGLAVKGADGAVCGAVRGVHNYGAGPFLEIAPVEGDSFMLPFTDTCVPEVDVDAGFVSILPPEGWLDAAGPEEESEPSAKPPKKGKA